MRTKRLLTLLLAALLLASTMTGCAGDTAETTPNADTSAITEETEPAW